MLRVLLPSSPALRDVEAERDAALARLREAEEQQPAECQWRPFGKERNWRYCDPSQIDAFASMGVEVRKLYALPKPSPDTISIQEAWLAAGGNPGITATKDELLAALRMMDEAVDDADRPAPVPDGMILMPVKPYEALVAGFVGCKDREEAKLGWAVAVQMQRNKVAREAEQPGEAK